MLKTLLLVAEKPLCLHSISLIKRANTFVSSSKDLQLWIFADS